MKERREEKRRGEGTVRSRDDFIVDVSLNLEGTLPRKEGLRRTRGRNTKKIF
jgi:hypothetical protein